MIIAIPTAGAALCAHFGHCEEFLFFEVDRSAQQIVGKKGIQPPPHQPGMLPPWIKEQGADIVICGGMGMRAQQLFQQALLLVGNGGGG